MSEGRRVIVDTSSRSSGRSAIAVYQVVANGGIRWNLDLEMIERALKLRDALQFYQDRYTNDEADPLEQEDCLSAEEWVELTKLKELLQPIKNASVSCQAVPVDG